MQYSSQISLFLFHLPAVKAWPHSVFQQGYPRLSVDDKSRSISEVYQKHSYTPPPAASACKTFRDTKSKTFFLQTLITDSNTIWYSLLTSFIIFITVIFHRHHAWYCWVFSSLEVWIEFILTFWGNLKVLHQDGLSGCYSVHKNRTDGREKNMIFKLLFFLPKV